MFRSLMFAATVVLLAHATPAQCLQDANVKPIHIEVQIPADAHLEIGGYLTQSSGGMRLFQSPAVPTGYSYSYVLKAMWHGKQVSRVVWGQPGQVVAVRFMSEDFRVAANSGGPENGKPITIPARDGFVTHQSEGRWWVFRNGSKEYAAFKKTGEPEKSVTRVNAAPFKVTLRAPDVATLEEYLTAKPGFVTKYEDGRLWVFRKDSKELAHFVKDGELAKQVVRPGAGPRGMTLKGPDRETLDAYLSAK